MLNQCSFIGHLGADVEVRTFSNGGKVANLRLAVSEKWKDREGNKQERTTWVPVAIFSEGLVRVAEQYLRKGSKVYVSGKFSVRKWQDQSGADRYSTEVVLQGFDATLVMLDGRRDDQGGGYDQGNQGGGYGGQDQGAPLRDLDSEIPF